MRVRTLITMCVLGFSFVLPGAVWAEQTTSRTSQYVTMDWSFKSDYRYVVYLKMYGQYNKTVRPRSNTHWTLDDSNAHKVSIRCWEGEKICYGAWSDDNKYWGVGRGDRHGCESCCVVCSRGDKGTRTIY